MASQTFEITPSDPWVRLYDSVKQEWVHNAELQLFGVFMDFTPGRYTLSAQCQQGKAVLYGSPLSEPLPTTLPSLWWRNSMARVMFTTNADDKQQYHLKFHISSPGYAKVAFYINGTLQEESIDRVYENDIAGVIMNAPGGKKWTYIYIFLVAGGLIELTKVYFDVY